MKTGGSREARGEKRREGREWRRGIDEAEGGRRGALREKREEKCNQA